MGPPTQLLLLLLLLQSQEWGAVSQDSMTPLMVNRVLGELITLALKFPTEEKARSITWVYNGTSIAFISLREDQSSEPHVTDPKLRERLSFTGCCSLQLSNLTTADTGSYTAQIATETSTKFFTYALRIFQRLPRPQAEVQTITYENGTCNAIFRCSVEEGRQGITYVWSAVGSGTVVSQMGSVLSDSWSLGDLDRNYTCTVMNRVSNSSSIPFLARQLCAGPKAAEVTYCPVKWIFLGKGLLLLVFLGILGTWHIQTWVLSKPLRSQGNQRPPAAQESQGH
ncbi:SLAM family member 6-like isoform X2 [Otolemur garnettii]|nr:SLAM family member 6-like isoform X2 [Otolemur garnettii]